MISLAVPTSRPTVVYNRCCRQKLHSAVGEEANSWGGESDLKTLVS